MAVATNWVPGASLPRPRRHTDRARPVPVPVSRGSGRRGSGQGLPRWWREAVAAVGLYAVYSATRGLKQGDIGSADPTGRALLDWERSWHVDPEHALNQFLFHLPALAVAASYFYAVLHYVVTPAVLVWMYRRRADHYRTARTTLVVATVLGLVGFWFLPTTPPRLLAGSGFHDTLADVSAWGWWGGQASAPRGLGGLTNQYAAMPSLHVGWALWSGWLIARHARGRAARTAGVLYPLLTALVVMSTGNHYLLDVAGGVADMTLAAGIVVLVGWAIRTVRGHRVLVRTSQTVTAPSATPAGDPQVLREALQLRAAGRRASHPLVGGKDDSEAPIVSQRTLVEHVVHHVRHRHTSVEVDQYQRTAPPAPQTGAIALQAVAHAVAHPYPEIAVQAMELLFQGTLAACRRQQPHPARGATARQHGLHGADRAGVAVSTHGGELGAPPGWAVRVEGVDPGVSRLAGLERRRRSRCWRDHRGDPVVVLGGQTDVEVGVQRPRHLVGEERAQALAGDPTDDLTDQKALGDRVVAGFSARLPAGGLSGQPSRGGLPVVEVVDRHRLVPGGQARGVGEQV